MTTNEMLDAALSYARLGLKVFPLVPRGKNPAIKGWQDKATTDEHVIRDWWTENPRYNVGIKTGDGLCVIDVDDKPEKHGGLLGSDFLRDWESENRPISETVCCKTPTGGMHYYFDVGDRRIAGCQSDEIYIDIRCDGNLIVAPPSVHPETGTAYEWDISPEDMPITKATGNDRRCIDWIHSKASKRKGGTGKTEIPETPVKSGEGRNNFLYLEGCSVRGRGGDDSMVEMWITQLNATKCDPPLPKREVKKIIESVCSLPIGQSAEAKEAAAKGGNKSRRFDHEGIARRLMDERGACFIDGMPAVKENGRYRLGWDSVDKAIIDMQRGTTRNNRAEVKALLQLDAPTLKQSRPTLIAFTNGVLDVETMELRDYQPADVIPNVVPHKWVPTARSADLWGMLERIACGDIGTMLNLAEFMGLCIARSSRRWPFFPVLTGEGSNGKSTYIRLLRDMAGAENVSGLQPSDITEKYNAAMLLGKTANLGDDISGGHLDKKDCSVIKKVATGDLLYTDVKYGVGFAFEPYATMVFSCNVFPTLGDTSYGMMRRLFPVEFRAKFSVNDPEYDPAIGEKLATEEVLEAACVLAVEGLKRVIAQGEPTRTEAVDFLLGNIKRDSDTVSAWVYQRGLTAEDFLGRSLESVFSDYASWCEANGYRKFMRGSSSLSAQIGTFFGISLTGYAREIRNGESKRVRVYELKEGNDTKTA